MFRTLAALSCALAAASAADSRVPCTAASPACMEKVPLGPAGRYSYVYRTYPLTAPDTRIVRALIVIHGAGRNANDYFASGAAGAQIAGTLHDTLVISPRIAAAVGSGCSDKLEPGEISWTCGGAQDWRRGGQADGIADLHTYDFVDELIRTLARKGVFPNLRTVVVTGHSAGGQFTNRYAAATRVESEVPFKLEYVVSNPSSYLYLDGTRLPAGASCTAKGSCDAEFRPYESKSCESFNQWHYGMEKRSGYAKDIPDETLRKQLISRNVTYLLGELDTLPLFGFDSTCPAMAQGPNRYARGLAYWNYMRSKYKADHKLIGIDACGHNGRCIYTSDAAFPALFP